MKNKSIVKWIGGAVASTLIFGTTVFASTSDNGELNLINVDNSSVESSLNSAIYGEYLAKTEYEKFIELFGEQRPFTNIVKSEDYHISLLQELFEKYNLQMPENNTSGDITISESITDAYDVAVDNEKLAIATYTKLLESENLPDDIRAVFEALRASSEKHLASFESKINGSGNYHSGQNGIGKNRSNGQQEGRGPGLGLGLGDRVNCIIE